LHDGPNKYSPLTQDEMKEFINDLLNSQQFIIVEKEEEALLLQKR